MNNFERTERLLNLVYIIQKSPGIRAKELGAIFGKTTRTIQRDIHYLRKIGFNIASSTGVAGGFASRGSYNLKPVVFSGAEALAVFVSSRVLLEQSGFPYINDLQSALGKISQVICEEDEELFLSLEPRTSVVVKQLRDYYPWGQLFNEINQAILEQVVIEITYDSYSSHAVSVRKVCPYHIMFKEGSWYLLAYCYKREEVRIFRIDRIKGIAQTEEKFQFPEKFSLGEYFKNSWQMGKGEPTIVKVRFDPPVSRLIRENTWHHTQAIEELDGDRLILTVCIEGTWEIKKWIMSWGAGAECLEPEELREEIGREMMEMAAKYSY